MPTYLITGASRGIGYDTALSLAKLPDMRLLAVSRDAARLQQLAAAVRQLNSQTAVYTLAHDIAAGDAALLADWAAAFGPIDGLLNNAGLLINKPFDELSADDWQRTFAVNVFAPARLIQALLPSLAQPAHVVNIGSMGGFQGSSKFPGLSAYSASKAALASLTECLAEECRERQLRVNALALGAVQTEMLAEAFPGYQAPVSSADMGAFVAWFLQHGHGFFNGKILPVSVSTP